MVHLILLGSLIVALSLILLLSMSLFILGHTYVMDRIIVGIIVVVYLLATRLILSKGLIKVAAWTLISLYTIIASSILWLWGINSPIGILMLGFVILLASVMLGARAIIQVTPLLALILCVLELMTISNVNRPDVSKLDDASSFGDVVSYIVVFGIFALISWMSIRRTELALKKAVDAEHALQQQKRQLARRLEERTRHLHEVQMEEMKNLYRFAELGQLTTVILHELANHLSVLALDIEEMGTHRTDNRTVRKAKESIFYIDTMIRQVRKQLASNTQMRPFDVLSALRETIQVIEPKARKVGIKVNTELPKRGAVRVIGDPLRLSQVLTVLVTNAVQASIDSDSGQRWGVIIKLEIDNAKLRVHVIDHGIGILPEARPKVFEPLRSTKENGLGVGLFIAKQIIETHFHGKILLLPSQEQTHFVIELHRLLSSNRNIAPNNH